MSRSEPVDAYDHKIYTDYKRSYDKPKPKFESVPMDQFPARWYENIGYFMLVILFNCVTFGFMCLMLFIRYLIGTEMFVRISVGVGGGVIALLVVGMYFGGRRRKREERQMFDKSEEEPQPVAQSFEEQDSRRQLH